MSPSERKIFDDHPCTDRFRGIFDGAIRWWKGINAVTKSGGKTNYVIEKGAPILSTSLTVASIFTGNPLIIGARIAVGANVIIELRLRLSSITSPRCIITKLRLVIIT